MNKKLVTAAMVISLGIFTFTGCSDEDSQGNDQRTEEASGIEENQGTLEPGGQESPASDAGSPPEYADEDVQENTEGDTGAVSGTPDTDAGGAEEEPDEDVSDDAGMEADTKTDVVGERDGSEGDLFMSADVSGYVYSIADTGCSMNVTVYEDDTASTAKVDNTGEGIPAAAIIYGDDCKFQNGFFQSDGSSSSLEDGSKSDVAYKSQILVFGNLQEDGSYLANEIIVVHFI